MLRTVTTALSPPRHRHLIIAASAPHHRVTAPPSPRHPVPNVPLTPSHHPLSSAQSSGCALRTVTVSLHHRVTTSPCPQRPPHPHIQRTEPGLCAKVCCCVTTATSPSPCHHVTVTTSPCPCPCHHPASTRRRGSTLRTVTPSASHHRITTASPSLCHRVTVTMSPCSQHPCRSPSHHPTSTTRSRSCTVRIVTASPPQHHHITASTSPCHLVPNVSLLSPQVIPAPAHGAVVAC